MSNYTQITFFTPKDSLLSGDPAKKIKGAQIDPELAAIATAITSKYDSANISSGPILFADGTAGGPGIAFASATGTGPYKAAANSLGFAANGVAAGSISSAQAWSIPAANAAVTLSLAGAANQYAQKITGSSTSGQSFGLLVNAGTTTADAAFVVQNQSAGTGYFEVLGNGEVYLQTPPAATNPPSGMFQAGYMESPLNSQSSSYPLALTDRGKTIQMLGNTLTIPANGSVAFPVGTMIQVLNFSSSLNIVITTDTLEWKPSNATGPRVLAVGGVATLYKRAATVWSIWGLGLT